MNGPLIVFAAAFLVLLPRFNAAEAAGPYDGEWAGTATSTGERCKQAEAAAAKQAAADAELRDKLIAATGGNVIRGPGIDDVSPIRAAMEIIPAERILSAIRCKTDRRLYPKNEPATSWREPRLLREIAESYCRTNSAAVVAASVGRTKVGDFNETANDNPLCGNRNRSR
jgi:hypothetical protein